MNGFKFLFSDAREFLKGKKVYIAATAWLCLSLESFIETGNTQALIEGIWQTFLIVVFRAAIKKAETK